MDMNTVYHIQGMKAKANFRDVSQYSLKIMKMKTTPNALSTMFTVYN